MDTNTIAFIVIMIFATAFGIFLCWTPDQSTSGARDSDTQVRILTRPRRQP